MSISVEIAILRVSTPFKEKKLDMARAANAADKLLLAAAADGNLDEVQRLVELDGADPNASDASGTSGLHAAAMADDADLAVLLLDMGASVDTRECPELGGHTPLLTAVLRGSERVAEVLLEAGAAPDAPEDGTRMTPMHHCARLAHLTSSMAIARLLLARGADSDALDGAGCNPAFYAKSTDSASASSEMAASGVYEGFLVHGAMPRVGSSESVPAGGAAFLALEGMALPRCPSVEEKHTGLAMRLQAQMALGVKPGKGPSIGKKKKPKKKK